MKEIQDKLDSTMCYDGSELYINSGIPRNRFNSVPGILFFERTDI